jgi:hypothetical protein
MKRFSLLYAVTACFLLILINCTGSPPEIIQNFHQLNIRKAPETGLIREQLSVFVQVEDEDGFDDIEALVVYSEHHDLVWEFNSNNWEYRERGGEEWIGFTALAMPDYSSIPRGEYQVEVTDLAGEKRNSVFHLTADKADYDAVPFPRFRNTGEGFLFENQSETVTDLAVWVFDPGNNFLGSYGVQQEGVIPIESLIPRGRNPKSYTFFAYGYWNTPGMGLIQGPYSEGDERSSPFE